MVYKNIELRKLTTKLYYQKNKEHLLAYRCENFECSCGGKYTRANKNKHVKTKKHLNFIV